MVETSLPVRPLVNVENRGDPSAAASVTSRTDRFPRGIPFIVGNEAAERFSYYGLRAILWVYLGALYLGFAPKDAVAAGDHRQIHAPISIQIGDCGRSRRAAKLDVQGAVEGPIAVV